MIVENNERNNILIEQISEIIAAYDIMLMASYPNVVGVGVGQKYMDGEPTGLPSLTILVSKKINECSLSDNEIIPQMFKGVMTDVYEVGNMYTEGSIPPKTNCANTRKDSCSCIKKSNNNCGGNGSNLGSYTSKFRPADGGVGVSRLTSLDTGTLGIGVSDVDFISIIGNNHVFADGNLISVGAPIIQPSKEYGGVASDQIAKLNGFIPIRFITSTTMPANRIDAAIATVGDKANEKQISTTLLKPGLHNGTKLTGTYTPQIGENVFKIGAISELTSGKVLTLNTSIKVPFSYGRQAYFTGQITTAAMAQAGDSGAIGFDGHNKAFGLQFAISTQITAYNPISEVLSAFEVNFWNL